MNAEMGTRHVRKLVAGTGWKMNIRAAEAARYASTLVARIGAMDLAGTEVFVLPPFTSLHAAAQAFAGTPVAIGGQNMHWEEAGAWTGETSAPMLIEAGCRFVELGHSERLQHFGENYALVRRKVDRAIASGLTPIVCLGESAREKREGRSDDVLREQVHTALEGLADEDVPQVILAYEPRWAIGSAEAASPDYIAQRHRVLREALRSHRSAAVAERTRIIYGGSVTTQNGRGIVDLDDVDGLFVGRAAWVPEGFARIIEIVSEAAKAKADRA
jgi:triosephosphate isomerase